eukprot:8679261-Heterocapsa_arctica.AAC.1
MDGRILFRGLQRRLHALHGPPRGVQALPLGWRPRRRHPVDGLVLRLESGAKTGGSPGTDSAVLRTGLPLAPPD